jgi:HK97 family phage major capsid protein
MEPELTKEFELIRGDLKKNVDAIARVDGLEAKIAGMTATAEDVKLVRAELDKVRVFVEERDKAIKELKEQGRVIQMRQDPIVRREAALEMLGMIVRQELARFNGLELPAALKHETALVRAYRDETLARATLTPMSGTGSYMVPTVTDRAIMDAIEEVSPVLGLVDLQTGLPPGGTFNFTFLASRPAMQPKRASSDTAMTASDPVFAQLQLSPNEIYVFFPIDNKMFAMSAIALGGYFEGLCRDAMIDKLAYWTLRADGTATYNSITGALNETTAAYILAMGAGKTAFSDLTAANLTDIKAKCLKRGRGKAARWLMDLEIQGIIEDIERTGKVPLIREKEDGTMLLKQNPIEIEEYMPGKDESAAATGFLLYGDLATILVGMVGGLQIASDASVKFDKNQTAFRATAIADIKRKPVATMILGKTAAA